jgi:hypothetical protein
VTAVGKLALVERGRVSALKKLIQDVSLGSLATIEKQHYERTENCKLCVPRVCDDERHRP